MIRKLSEEALGIIRAAKYLVMTERPVELPENMPPPPDKQSILIIDDQMEFLVAMRCVLEGEGYHVIVSNDGAKGLEMLRFAPKSLRVVLLDYNMQRLNGLETLKHIRDLRPHVKVIGITGAPLADVPAEFRDRVDKFFSKPVRPVDLLAEVCRLFS